MSRAEFEGACRDFKIGINSEDIAVLFNAFDVNRDGTVQYDEFVRTIRGDLTGYRRKLVYQAFTKLDKDGSGIVDIDDIRGIYNAKKHPAVVEGRKTED